MLLASSPKSYTKTTPRCLTKLNLRSQFGWVGVGWWLENRFLVKDSCLPFPVSFSLVSNGHLDNTLRQKNVLIQVSIDCLRWPFHLSQEWRSCLRVSAISFQVTLPLTWPPPNFFWCFNRELRNGLANWQLWGNTGIYWWQLQSFPSLFHPHCRSSILYTGIFIGKLK